MAELCRGARRLLDPPTKECRSGFSRCVCDKAESPCPDAAASQQGKRERPSPSAQWRCRPELRGCSCPTLAWGQRHGRPRLRILSGHLVIQSSLHRGHPIPCARLGKLEAARAVFCIAFRLFHEPDQGSPKCRDVTWGDDHACAGDDLRDRSACIRGDDGPTRLGFDDYASELLGPGRGRDTRNEHDVGSTIDVRELVSRAPALDLEPIPDPQRVRQSTGRVRLWTTPYDDEARRPALVDSRKDAHGIENALLGHEPADVRKRQLIILEGLATFAESLRIEAERNDADGSSEALAPDHRCGLPAARVDPCHACVRLSLVESERWRVTLCNVLSRVHDDRKLARNDLEPLMHGNAERLLVEIDDVWSHLLQESPECGDVCVGMPIHIARPRNREFFDAEPFVPDGTTASFRPRVRYSQSDVDPAGRKRSFSSSMSRVAAGVVDPEDAHAHELIHATELRPTRPHL